MKHIWTILCQNSSRDSNTNLLSIFNCLEEIILKIDISKTLKKDEFSLPISMQLVSLWSINNQNKDNTLDISVEMLDPDGKLLNTFTKKFDVKSGFKRFRSILNIQRIKITRAGRYIIRMKQKQVGEKDFNVVEELPLDIKVVSTEKL